MRTLLILACSISSFAVGQEKDSPPADLDEKILSARIERSPQEVIDQMLNYYGKSFGGSYVEALSVIVRLREQGIEEVEPVVARQLAKPAPLGGGSQIAGRLIFAEMAPQNPVAKKLAIEAADLAFFANGKPREAMPYHNEMSDAIFMGGPILAKVGTLTVEPKYYDEAIRQIRFIQKHCLREDGLYRHSPLHDTAWGRGNGFPALGIAMILEELPKNHPDREFAVNSLKQHLEALRPFQDKEGMWHQVIDHPESYPEFTCTCMISYAALVAIRNFWTDQTKWDDSLRASWKAICSRIDLDGREINGACTGTGKQKSLEAYLQRAEINGFDSRSGSMALLFASEMKTYMENHIRL